MPGLNALKLKTAYHKGRDDIATEFYLPCMMASARYDRAVGFFSSTIYILAWNALKAFVNNRGKMRLICSPVLSPEDVAALKEGHAAHTEQKLAEALRIEVERLLSDPYLHKPSRVLASLISLGIIEVKIAVVGLERQSPRLFHDKMGIFADSEGHVVIFKGSMNETWSGLANDGNLESIDVFVSWEDAREANRCSDDMTYFEALWQDRYPQASVRPFPQIALDLIVTASEPSNWSSLVDEVCDEIAGASRLSADRSSTRRLPRPHQSQAINNWLDHGRRGIFEHATGSGKTFTALCTIRDSIARNEVPVILVPSELLLGQWLAELRDTLADLKPNILPCGAGHVGWRDERLLRPWTRNRQSGATRIVLSTMQTASSEVFRSALEQGSHLFLVADEVHRIGSPGHRTLLTVDTGPRLGLSATPRRAGDPEGTAAVFEYFGGVVPPPFTLVDAIRSKTLTPYFYHVHQVAMDADEQTQWDTLTRQIGVLAARARSSKTPDLGTATRIKHLLIQRSRIAKTASAKTPLALAVLRQYFAGGQKWIVYCDDQAQLASVLDAATSAGLPAAEYHSTMAGNRDHTLHHFATNGGILVSIRCLDEGVDIPSVTHALILASSQNSREFIQRRGRVLRLAPGKSLAFIHDAVVVPTLLEGKDPDTSLLESEIARAIEFGRHAENPSAITDLERMAARVGLDVQALIEGGYEDDQ